MDSVEGNRTRPGWRRHATRRRIAGGATGIAMLALVAVAVAVPGAGPLGATSPGAAGGTAPPASSGSPGAGPGASAAASPGAGVQPLNPVRVATAIRYRDSWGVRALTVADDAAPATPDNPPELQEFWTRIPWLDAAGVAESGPVTTLPGPLTFQTGDRPVLAIGITSPDRKVPLDARIWHVRGGDLPQRIVPRVMTAEPGRTVWLPTTPDGEALTAWPPGLYRIDLIVARRIVRVSLGVPGVEETERLAGNEPAPDPRLAAMPDDEIRAALEQELLDETFTGFVVTGGEVVPLPRATDRARDELTSWLDPVLPGRGRGFAERARFGSVVVGTSATAIGWILPAGAEARQTDVYMLAPREERLRVQTTMLRVARGASFADAVLVRPVAGARWPAAVYRLEASWAEHGGGIAYASWHVDLTPAIVEVPGGSQADLARVWREKEASLTASAEFDPVIYDTVPLLDAGDAESGLSASKPGEACLDRRLISPEGGPLGIRGLDGEDISTFQVYRVFDGGTRVPIASGLVPDAAPDLALVMTPIQGWQPGAYRIVLRFAGGLRARPAMTFLVCTGVIDGERLIFDPASTSG